MTIYGFHASHEQVHPAALLDAVQRAEAAGFTAAMCSDHFSPWSERQGHSPRSPGPGSARRWRRRACRSASSTPRAALPPGDHRPGDRHARRDVPGPLLGGARHRRGVATSTSRATAGRARRSATPGCASAWTSSGRCSRGEEVSHDGLVTVDRARVWTRPAEPPSLVAAAVTCRDRAVVRRLGRRADHRRPAPPTGCAQSSAPTARPAAAARCGCRCTSLRGRRREALGSRTSSGAATCSPRRSAGISSSSSTSTRPRGTWPPRPCARSSASPRDPGRHAAWLQRVRRSRLRRALPAPRRPGAGGVHRRVRRAGAARSCRGAGHEDHRDQRPVVEERGRLLPGRRDLPRLRRRRPRRLPRPGAAHRLPGELG